MSVRSFRVMMVTLLGLGHAGCGAVGSSGRIVITGTIQNVSGTQLPADTRLLVVWTVASGSPDYTYVWGEGAIDRVGGTFVVQLDNPPPGDALNAGGLGVGVLVLTTDRSLETGDDLVNVPLPRLLGAAGQFGVIYVDGDPTEAAAFRAWAADFPTGYSVGGGQAVPSDFDRFVPDLPDNVVIVVDDWANIGFVEWT